MLNSVITYITYVFHNFFTQIKWCWILFREFPRIYVAFLKCFGPRNCAMVLFSLGVIMFHGSSLGKASRINIWNPNGTTGERVFSYFTTGIKRKIDSICWLSFFKLQKCKQKYFVQKTSALKAGTKKGLKQGSSLSKYFTFKELFLSEFLYRTTNIHCIVSSIWSISMTKDRKFILNSEN